MRQKKHKPEEIVAKLRQTESYSDEARCLIPLRAMVSELIDLLDRIDDLVAAQRDIGDLLH